MKLKNLIFAAIFLLANHWFFAQTTSNIQQATSINDNGSAPDASAILDISATDKGMLVPRLDIADLATAAPVASPAASLLVYNTNVVTGPGFFYWDGTEWKALATGAGGISEIVDADGDTKVVAGEDFVSIQVDTTERARFEGARLEFLNNGSSVFIGEDAGSNDDLTLNRNVFLGNAAGNSNTSGANNTYLGHTAGTSGISNFNNVAVGTYSLLNNTGNANIGIGVSALRNQTLNTNVGIGRDAGYYSTSGFDNVIIGDYASRGTANYSNSNHNTILGAKAGLNIGNNSSSNVFLGAGAGRNTLGSGNVFLGYFAGENESSSNKLYIENSNSSSPLIYGDFANDTVGIYGTLKIKDEYIFPMADGLANQVLSTDGSGNVTWQTLSGGGSQTLTRSSDSLEISGGNKVSIVASRISDADEDTRVEAGEDFVSIKIDTTEKIRFEECRMEFLNTGESIFIGENAGLNDDLSNNYNISIGNDAGSANTSGSLNTYLGHEAGKSNVTTTGNTAMGFRALKNATNGANTAIGGSALEQVTTGLGNTAVGRWAMSLGNGINNAAFGREAGYSESGSNNTYLGPFAGSGVTGANRTGNVFIGYDAGKGQNVSNHLFIENSDSASPLIWGDFANDSVRINGVLDINKAYCLPASDGSANQVLTTNGSGSVSWTSAAGGGMQNLIEDNIDGDTEVKTYDAANFETEDHIRLEVDGTTVLYLDRQTLHVLNTGKSVFIGEEAGANDDLSDNRNTFLGYYSGTANTTGFHNTFLGDSTGYDNTTGSWNTFVGGFAGANNTTGQANTFVGTGAGIANTNTERNTFIGYFAGSSNDWLGNDNTFVGYRAGNNNYNGALNTFIGKSAGHDNVSGFSNTFIGLSAGLHNVGGRWNTCIGSTAGADNINGDHNIVIGNSASQLSDSIANCVIIGDFAAYANTTGTDNTILGYQAGRNSDGSKNVFLGYQAGYYETGDDKLYIENTDGATPLIWGDFNLNRVGINRVATTNTLEVSGNASKASAGSWLANSDARLKKDIQNLDAEKTLQLLLQLKGITYEWNDDQTGHDRPEGTQFGFTAQNIQEVFPELVTEDAQGFLQTAYGTYDAMTVEAIRALFERIQSLEKENAALQENLVQLKTQQNEIDQLKAEMQQIRVLLGGVVTKN